MPETPLQKLRKLSQELGSPGVEAFWRSSQKAGLNVTKAQVREVIGSSSSRQIFGKLQPSDGKTVSRAPNDSWQMDLADLRNSPAEKAKYTKGKKGHNLDYF